MPSSHLIVGEAQWTFTWEVKPSPHTEGTLGGEASKAEVWSDVMQLSYTPGRKRKLHLSVWDGEKKSSVAIC